MADLLKQLVMAEARLVRLSAELVRQPDASQELSTKIEFKLVPLQPEAADEQHAAQAKPTHQLQARLSCKGANVSKAASEPVFSVECMMQMSYRQVLGPALAFDEFKAHHMSLSRQIYPLLIQQAQPLLAQLGLQQVRLPMDMLQLKASAAERPDQVH